ncbi:MAG: alpha-mannosidase [Clostridia bacterium]|nr:alpha-mannosidase [Clostridia bacterium]
MIMHQLDSRIGRILKELRQGIARRSVRVDGIEISARGSGEWTPFKNGDFWGADGEWWDFRFKVTVPEDFTDRVKLRVRTGCERGWDATNPQFVARVNGRVEQALDTNHTTLLLQNEAHPGETFDILLNGYAAGGRAVREFLVLDVWLEDVNSGLEQLIYDLDVPLQAVMLMEAGARERETTLETLARAVDLLDLREPHSAAFDAAVQEARAYLKREYYDRRAALPPVAVAECVGHTHIDVAWLWDIDQTRHKAVRSFATVLKLMEQYPEYRFMSSQPVLYKFVKEDEPELFERIREAVNRGQWEPEGGMWLEADCNLTGGESLVRQFMHGQEFFMKEFGRESRILWLPDVFGYSAALPQIMKLAGVRYFMTTKLSWSEFNTNPYDTFTWKGIDGSEVLTHFSSGRDFVKPGTDPNDARYTTYNAFINPRQIRGGWQRFQQRDIDDHILISYGFGDGGGGPTVEMLENQRRMATPLPETPVTRQSHALPFFQALEARMAKEKRLPKWYGELYLEYHRGTYTAMARNKRYNRKIELLLRDVELWRAMAARCGLPYPAEELHDIWENALTLQFHDILPGSSIKKVYDDSKAVYERLFPRAEALKAEALDALAQRAEGDVKLFNSLSFDRDDVVWFDAPEDVTALRGGDGGLYPVQHACGRAAAFVKGLRAMSMTPFWFVREPVEAEPLTVSPKGFDTPFLHGEFDEAMRVKSLVEKKSGREIAKAGQSLNRLVCYENKPHNYDAWDVNIYYSRRFWEIDRPSHVEVIERGPVLAKIRVIYPYMKSTIAQDIVIYRDLPRIDFETTVDWREKQYLLKAHFPVDVFYNEATFDIQYGNVKRATHKNTSWDAARFEVCAHKWIDVAEEGFGMSLLNDCKYGHSVDENGMALTLLKSSVEPNPDADQEIHRFTYSLMPHEGGWREEGTVDQAYALNVSVSAVATAGEGEAPAPFVKADRPNLVIEAVKAANDGDGLIVRVYENFGRREAKARLSAGFPIQAAEIYDLLERRLEDAVLEDDAIAFSMHPYEIKTFRIRG